MFKLDKKIWSSCVSNQGQFELFLLLKTSMKENVLMMDTATLTLQTWLPQWHLSSAALSRHSGEFGLPGYSLPWLITHCPTQNYSSASIGSAPKGLHYTVKLYWKVGKPFTTVFIFDNGRTLVLGFALYQICCGKRRKISADKISCQICL